MPSPEFTVPPSSSRPASPASRRPPTFHQQVLTYVAWKVQAEVNAAEAASWCPSPTDSPSAWPDVFEPSAAAEEAWPAASLSWKSPPTAAPDRDSAPAAPPPSVIAADDEPAESTTITTTDSTPLTTVPIPLPFPHPTALYRANLAFYILDYRLLWAEWALTRTHTPRVHERGSSSASEAGRAFIGTSPRAARHYRRVDIAHAIDTLADARTIPLAFFRGSGAAYVGDADRRALGCCVRMRECLLGGGDAEERDWIARPGGGRGEESAGVVAWVVWWFGGRGEREGWEGVLRGHLGRGVEEMAGEGGRGGAKGVEERWRVGVERRMLMEERGRLVAEMEEMGRRRWKGRPGRGDGSEVARAA